MAITRPRQIVSFREIDILSHCIILEISNENEMH